MARKQASVIYVYLDKIGGRVTLEINAFRGSYRCDVLINGAPARFTHRRTLAGALRWGLDTAEWQAELLGFGKGTGVDRIRDVLGEDASAGTADIGELFELDAQSLSDLHRGRIELRGATFRNAAWVKRVLHFALCSPFSKIRLIRSAPGRFGCT